MRKRGSQKGRGCTPYRKLTLAETFNKGTISNAYGSSMQAGAARRISVRFAEAAALPCVQNMRGASDIIPIIIPSPIIVQIMSWCLDTYFSEQ